MPTQPTGWAKPVSELFVPEMPGEARNLNVNGRRPVGPVRGFGRLCQKTFRLHIGDPKVSPVQAIKELKGKFPGFFSPPSTGSTLLLREFNPVKSCS